MEDGYTLPSNAATVNTTSPISYYFLNECFEAIPFLSATTPPKPLHCPSRKKQNTNKPIPLCTRTTVVEYQVSIRHTFVFYLSREHQRCLLGEDALHFRHQLLVVILGHLTGLPLAPRGWRPARRRHRRGANRRRHLRFFRGGLGDHRRPAERQWLRVACGT